MNDLDLESLSYLQCDVLTDSAPNNGIDKSHTKCIKGCVSNKVVQANALRIYCSH